MENFSIVRDRMESAEYQCGRKVGEVKLLPVTKTHPIEAVHYALEVGLDRVGENRVQEAVCKISESKGLEISWDLIGHLQSNKAALAVKTFNRIESVDSIRLARKLDGFAFETPGKLSCLIQVNSGKDPKKYGFDIEGFEDVFDQLLEFDNLEIDGLMTIAPFEGGRDAAKIAFVRLRELIEKLRIRSGLPLAELSMGMSGDMEDAIAEGSTLIRVGSALFGRRE